MIFSESTRYQLPACDVATLPASEIFSTFRMQQPITGFHIDDEQHWVAELACGHGQHVRHVPPWTLRPWVVTEAGRTAMIGQLLNCRLCDDIVRTSG